MGTETFFDFGPIGIGDAQDGLLAPVTIFDFTPFAPPAPDNHLPIVTIISPTPGVDPGSPGGFPASYAAAAVTPIVLTVHGFALNMLYICISVRLLNGTLEEVVYRRGVFRGLYAANSTQFGIDLGVQLSVQRSGGWPGDDQLGDIIFAVDPIDQAGNLGT